MKVIFLDIDGVLNTSGHISWRFKQPKERRTSSDDWCPIACSNLNAIGEVVPGEVGIVLSSTWRLGRNIIDLRQLLTKNNIKLPFYGVTPALGFDPHKEKPIRGMEIKQWLDRPLRVDRYVIIDDDTDMLPEQLDNFVHCNHVTGLADHKKVTQTIKILS